MRRLLISLTLAFPLALGCGASGDGDGSGGSGGDGGGGTGGGNPAECEFPTSQAASQPCCLAHGADACGALLFCAAFDGRTQPTCYPERSRADGAECGADLHCTSGSCNLDAKKCRATAYTACDPAIGCAIDHAGDRYACFDDGEGPECRRVGDGSYGTPCLEAADCDSGICENASCGLDLTCVPPGGGDGPCAFDPNGSQCEACFYEMFQACGAVCQRDAQAAIDCWNAHSADCHGDPICLIQACSVEFCGFFGCAEERCSTEITCF